MARDVFVIMNPKAGAVVRDPDTPARIEAALADHGVRPTIHLTAGPGDARVAAQRAVREGFEGIAVAAGDGTVGEVVGPVSGTGVPLGIIPVGTANALARELKLPYKDPPAACRVVAAGRTRDIDLGVGNGTPFAIMLGVGFDAAVARETERGGWKRVMGRWAFVGQALQSLLRERPRRFTVTIDGETLEERGWAVVVCNGEMYSWRLRFAPGGRIDDGKLDVIVFRHVGRAQLLANVGWHWASKGETELEHTIHRQGRQIRIEADPPARWQSDGEPRGASPIEIAVQPGALRVIVPPEEDG